MPVIIFKKPEKINSKIIKNEIIGLVNNIFNSFFKKYLIKNEGNNIIK